MCVAIVDPRTFAIAVTCLLVAASPTLAQERNFSVVRLDTLDGPRRIREPAQASGQKLSQRLQIRDPLPKWIVVIYVLLDRPGLLRQRHFVPHIVL